MSLAIPPNSNGWKISLMNLKVYEQDLKTKFVLIRTTVFRIIFYFNYLLNPVQWTPRLNMELNLQSLFGLLCTAVLIG
jgi:hypothetical protein